MNKHGDYEVERAIGWGRSTTYFLTRARARANGSRIVLRVSRSADAESVHKILSSATEQMAAIAAGCTSFAPVHATFVDECGRACIATDLSTASLADYLEAGIRIDAEFLKRTVVAIVRALKDLSEKARRAHGNLRAGNVLLDAAGRVALADPAPTALDASQADDLHSVGTCIYQLVRSTAKVGQLNPPIEHSPEWTEALGDSAAGWLAITNRLLTRGSYAGAEGFDRILADVERIEELLPAAADQPRKRPIRALLIAALVGLCAVAGVSVWKIFSMPVKPPGGSAATPTPKPGTVVARILKEISGPRPEVIKTDARLSAALGRLRADVSEKTSDESALDAIELRLRSDWLVPEENAKIAAVWRENHSGWSSITQELETACDVKLDPTDSTLQLLPILESIALANQRARRIESEWAGIQTRLRDMAEIGSELVPNFNTSWASKELEKAGTLENAVVIAEGIHASLNEARQFVTGDLPLVHWARFKSDTEAASIMMKQPRPDWPREWVRVAKRFHRPSAEKISAWNVAIEAAEKRIESLKNRPAKEINAWKAKVSEAKEKVAAALASDDPASLQKLLDELAKIQTPEEEGMIAFGKEFETFKTSVERAPDVAKALELLTDMQTKWEKLNDVVRAAFGKKSFTPDWPAKIAALNKKPNLTLFKSDSRWAIEKTPEPDVNFAVYLFKGQNGSARVPFLRIAQTTVAMSTIEIPLAFGKATGIEPKDIPGLGPKVRAEPKAGSAMKYEVSPDNWLWGPLTSVTPLRVLGAEYPEGMKSRPGGGIDYFAGGVRPHSGAFDTVPLTWISQRNAQEFAGNVGCRLPSADEWGKALPDAGPQRALLGTAMVRQVQHLFDTENGWGNIGFAVPGPSSPTSGGYAQPRLQRDQRDQRDKRAAPLVVDPGADNANILWLRALSGRWDTERKFVNLIGNAAEWLSDGSVAGGSCASKPEVRDQPQGARGAYFDVGFRLVAAIDETGNVTKKLEDFKSAILALKFPPTP